MKEFDNTLATLQLLRRKINVLKKRLKNYKYGGKSRNFKKSNKVKKIYVSTTKFRNSKKHNFKT